MQPREVSELDDIADWVVACSDNEIDEAIRSLPSHLQYRLQQRTGQPRHGGSELVTRRFSANMSLKTVRRISHEWHEAVANHMPEGSLVQFPEPWIDGADLGNYKIVPIRDSRELYLAAKTLHNCATTYGDVICYGQDYLYTVRDEGGKTIVMIELGRDATGASLRQVKAYCNAPAPKEIERLVMRWFNHNKAAVRFPPAPEPRTNRSLPWDEEGVPF
jgi:hypothetical protein